MAQNDTSMSASAASGIFGLISSGISAYTAANENELNRFENWSLQRDQQRYNTKEAEKAFERQKELLGLQQDYQSSREDSQYQRQVADAIKAGLNPSVAGGQVAPTAPVAATQVNAAHGTGYMLPKWENPGRYIADAGNNLANMLFAARKQQAEVNNLNSQSNYNDVMSRVNLILGLANEERISSETAGQLIENELKKLDFDIKRETVINIQSQTRVNMQKIQQIQADASLTREQRNTELSKQAQLFSQTVLNEVETKRKWLTLEAEINRLQSEANLNEAERQLVMQKGITEFFNSADVREQLLTHQWYRRHQNEFFELEKFKAFSHSLAEQINAGANMQRAFVEAFDKTYNAEKDRENRLEQASILSMGKSIGLFGIPKSGFPKGMRPPLKL